MTESCSVYTHRADSVVCWNGDVSRVCLQRACDHVLNEISDNPWKERNAPASLLKTDGHHHGKDELFNGVDVLAKSVHGQALRSVLSKRSAK